MPKLGEFLVFPLPLPRSLVERVILDGERNPGRCPCTDPEAPSPSPSPVNFTGGSIEPRGLPRTGTPTVPATPFASLADALAATPHATERGILRARSVPVADDPAQRPPVGRPVPSDDLYRQTDARRKTASLERLAGPRRDTESDGEYSARSGRYSKRLRHAQALADRQRAGTVTAASVSAAKRTHESVANGHEADVTARLAAMTPGVRAILAPHYRPPLIDAQATSGRAALPGPAVRRAG